MLSSRSPTVSTEITTAGSTKAAEWSDPMSSRRPNMTSAGKSLPAWARHEPGSAQMKYMRILSSLGSSIPITGRSREEEATMKNQHKRTLALSIASALMLGSALVAATPVSAGGMAGEKYVEARSWTACTTLVIAKASELHRMGYKTVKQRKCEQALNDRNRWMGSVRYASY